MPREALTECPFRDRIADFTGSGAAQVMALLQGGKLRFSEILREMAPMSKRMLSKYLRELEADGLVLRQVYPTKPPSVTYEMTALGLGLLQHLQGIGAWAEEHRAEIDAARRKFIA